MCSLYVQPLVNHTHWLECILVTSMQTIIPILPCHIVSRRLRATIEFWYYCLVIWISVGNPWVEILKPRNLLTYSFLKVSRFCEYFSFFLFFFCYRFQSQVCIGLNLDYYYFLADLKSESESEIENFKHRLSPIGFFKPAAVTFVRLSFVRKSFCGAVCCAIFLQDDSFKCVPEIFRERVLLVSQ